MFRGVSRRRLQQRITKWLALSGSVLGLAALAGCGGGSSSSTTPTGPTLPTIDNVCSNAPYSASPAPVSQYNTLFGMHIHSLAPGTPGGNGTPWPGTITLVDDNSNPPDTVQFGGIRLWDSGTGWADMNTAAATCDFTHMDSWIQEAQANGVDVLYDLGRTPTWASSNPTDSNCSYTADGGDGQCDPPSDLNSDGSGPDDIWIGWVTSVATHYKGYVKYYEIWNEWNISNFWVGTTAQLVRMTQDARCVVEGPPPGGSCNSNSTFPSGTGIDPSARIISPAPVGSQNNPNAAQKNAEDFLTTTADGMLPGSFVDIVGFHCYVSTKTVGDYPYPEQVLKVISDLQTDLTSANGVQNDPVFCTEGGFGSASEEGFTDPDLQAGFVARYYLLQNPTVVSRVYWYSWDSTTTYPGALWDSTSGVPYEAATAYAEVYKWITGATASNCQQNGTVWTCNLTRSGGGYQAQAVWDGNTASSCYTAGAPTCSTYTVPSGYTLSRDLTGKESSVSAGASVNLSAKPILLESSSLP